MLNQDGDFVGFDVVIGNPPYGVRAVEIDKKYFKSNYSSIIGKYDSYGFFIEQGLNLMKEKGFIGYIIPHTWLTVLEAQTIRDLLLLKCKIDEVILLPSKVFEDATVETSNLFAQKKENCTNYNVKIITFDFKKEIENIECSKIEYEIPIDIWIKNRVFNPNIRELEDNILAKLNNQSIPLEDLCELSVGVQAYDSHTGQTKETISNRVYHSKTKTNETYIRELNGRDVLRYNIKSKGESWISYGPWLAHPRHIKFFDRERILVREITSQGKYTILATYIEEYLINYKSILNIIKKDSSGYDIDLKFILGVLNSSFMSWFFNIKSNKIVTKTFPRISIYDLKSFPIVVDNTDCQITISDLVVKVLNHKKEDENFDTSYLESQIDQLVYQLYDLTEDEIEIIENN